MSYAKYGLTATDATSANHKKGVVAGPDGKYYQIDGFKSKGEDEGGIDQNEGKVFSSSLEADAGVDYSNFNTPQDVENALRELGSPKDDKAAPLKDVEVSSRLATARARAAQYEEDRVSGQSAKDLYNPGDNPGQGFLDRYKMKLGERLENGNYRPADASVTNSSKVGSGENDVSMDTADFARTGKDNRKGY
jgi:hypothetical protein